MSSSSIITDMRLAHAAQVVFHFPAKRTWELSGLCIRRERSSTKCGMSFMKSDTLLRKEKAKYEPETWASSLPASRFLCALKNMTKICFFKGQTLDSNNGICRDPRLAT